MPSSSPQTILWSLLAGLSLVFGPCAAVAQQADSPIIRYSDLAHPQFGDAGMVASQNYLSSQVGAEILAAGGNAVDAAVAYQIPLGGSARAALALADQRLRGLDVGRDQFIEADMNRVVARHRPAPGQVSDSL